MKVAVGLIWLGLAGAALPAGLAGLPHLGGAILGAAAAAALVLGACLVGPALAAARSIAPRRRRSRRTLPSVAPRWQ
jgi:hypothetical protein